MRISLLLIAASIFTGCRNTDRIPSDVIPKEKMQAVLRDMMRADQFLSDYVFSRDSTIKKDSTSIEYYSRIFAIHQISKKEFQRSFTFYKNHPAFLKTIMDSLSKAMAHPEKKV